MAAVGLGLISNCPDAETVGNPDNPGIEASDPSEDCDRAPAGECTTNGPGGMAVPLGAASAD